MTARRILLLAAATLLGGASVSDAQTRFSLSGGALVPLGDFSNRVDASARFGLRAEYQSVNAIGTKSRLSYFAQFHYTNLVLTEAEKDALQGAGRSTDGYMIDVGGGVRIYSRLTLFFVTAGGGWVRTDVGDARDSGGEVFGGAGFAVPLWLFMAEGQVTAHAAFFPDDEVQYLNATVSLAMPF